MAYILVNFQLTEVVFEMTNIEFYAESVMIHI